jgi:hypothetical protein
MCTPPLCDSSSLTWRRTVFPVVGVHGCLPNVGLPGQALGRHDRGPLRNQPSDMTVPPAAWTSANLSCVS